MMSIRWITFLAIVLFQCAVYAKEADGFQIVNIDFDLQDLSNKDCAPQSSTDEQLSNISSVLQDPKFWKELVAKDIPMDDQRLKQTVFVVGVDKKDLEELNILGMSAKQSLIFSGDQEQDAVCAEGHDQGTMNNRFCHSYIAQSFSRWLEKRGLSHTLASFVGGVFWVPKEFLVDMNPSAHDLPFTLSDKLGTKSTTFQVTVYGDAFYKHYFGKDFALFKESTPFLSITRKF